MATTTPTLKSITVSLVLANGTTSQGTVKTVSISLGQKINTETYTDAKAGNIIYDLIDVLALNLYNTKKTMTYNLSIE